MHESSSCRTRALAWVLATTLLGLAPALAQAPADAVFKAFKPSGDFLVELDGQQLDNAEMYHSERAGAYLIITPELKSPLLINTRSGSVESVSLLKVAKRDNGTIDLLADASFERVSMFQAGPNQLTFDVKGQKAVLKPKPPLLGFQSSSSLKSHNPSYAFKADEYSPEAAGVESLKGEQRQVKVVVYFGTWCPVCSRLVPRVMKVADQLEGSQLSFEYYGLPRNLTDDPVSDENQIRGVPTGIVYVDGKETARLDGRDLNKPENALKRILGGA